MATPPAQKKKTPATVEKKVTKTPGGLSQILKNVVKKGGNDGVQKKGSAVAEVPSKKDKKHKDNKDLLNPAAPSKVVPATNEKNESAPTAQKRRKKDPNAPKGAKSAYIFFGDKERAKIIKENPNFSPTEIMTELGKRWKELSEKEKRPYEKEAEKDKARYSEAMKSYEPAERDDDEKQGKRQKKDPNAPKNAKSAYIFFTMKKRASIASGSSPTEIMQKLGKMWSAMSEAEKKPYEDSAKKDKERYEREMAKYKRKQN